MRCARSRAGAAARLLAAAARLPAALASRRMRLLLLVVAEQSGHAQIAKLQGEPGATACILCLMPHSEHA